MQLMLVQMQITKRTALIKSWKQTCAWYHRTLQKEIRSLESEISMLKEENISRSEEQS